MGLTRRSILSLLAALCLLSPSIAVADPIIGQVDDFEDGTTQDWIINLLGMAPPPPAALPINVPTGGPGGVGDNFLQLTSLGGDGPGSRLGIINLAPRWTGDYLAAGVTALTMDVNNLGVTDLFLRVVFEHLEAGPPTDLAFSTDPVLVPAGSGWIPATFFVRPEDLTAGLGSINAALTEANLIRIYHSPDLNFPNPVFPTPAVTAQLGVDNITALSVPAPSSIVLLALGLAMSATTVSRRRRAGGE